MADDALLRSLIDEVTYLRARVAALETQETRTAHKEPLMTGASGGEFVLANGDVIMVDIYG